PAGAPDPGDEHDLLGRDAQFGHELLDGREHRVVAAARAPAGLLVGLEVRLGQLVRCPAVAVGHYCAHCRSAICSSISEANNGCPCTLQNDSTSIRYLARSSMA